MQLGIHSIDTLAYLLGPISGATGRFAHLHADADIDDVAVVTLEFESGALASVTGSYVSPKTLSLRLLGTEAVLDVRTDMSVWPDAQALDGATTMTLGDEAMEFDDCDMLAEELAEFGHCMAGDAEPETGAAEGMVALGAVLEAIGDGQALESAGAP
jgi:predicted dehydrogenase